MQLTTTTDGDEDTASRPSISFIVTGFGPFNGVRDNPTQYIVEELVQHLKTPTTSPPSLEYLSGITQTLLLETSAKAVVLELDRLHDELVTYDESSPPRPTTTVLLHLGVNYRGTDYQLEQCAYNNATFRVADEQGYQPQQQCIVDDVGFESCLTSRLNALELVEQTNVSTMPHDCKATKSSDPGRFVCNYAYCYSLQKFHNHDQCETKSTFRSLFVHVPPESVASKAAQLEFVGRLMDAIYQQLSKEIKE